MHHEISSQPPLYLLTVKYVKQRHDWREWQLVTDMHFVHALVNQDAHPHMLQKHLYSSPLCVEPCALVCEEKSNGGATTRHTLVG